MEVPRFYETGLKGSSFLEVVGWSGDFCELVCEMLRRFLEMIFCMVCLYYDVLSSK